MLEYSSDKLSRAVLQTITYSDIFDYPLTAREIHRYLTGVKASFDEVAQVAEEAGVVTRTGEEYFTLPGREQIARLRVEREARSRKLLPRAISYGRMLGRLPYVRMVALTGSLAVMNISANHDFDYMLVTKPGRLWTARALAVALGRMMRSFGHRICVNLLLSENALAWNHHDLYSAREICQLIPITGMDVYQAFRAANAWTESVLPNAGFSSPNLVEFTDDKNRIAFQRMFEMILRAPGLEQWAMDLQVRHIARKWGTGDETNFNGDVCQSNFHNHRKWTREAFEQRLSSMAFAVPLEE